MASIFALALIAVGAPAGEATLVDDQGAAHRLPDASLPTLVIYEDQEGGKQNKAVKDLIAAYHDPMANRARFAVWPVADLSRWNWWPAKKSALAEVKKSAEQSKTRILIDWTGALHKAWGFSKKRNSIVLVVDGKVRFSSEGECSPQQKDALERELKALGLSLP